MNYFRNLLFSDLHVIVIKLIDIPFINTVFCDVMPCRLVEMYQTFQNNLLPPSYS